MFEFMNLRQIDRVNERETGERAGSGGENDERDKRRASGKFAAAALG